MTITDETTEAGTGYEVRYVALADVQDNPYNVRSETERTQWAKSIAANGIQQPIVVRELDDGSLGSEDGECRKYSALKAGVTHTYVLVKKGSSSFDAARMVYVGNQHRQGLDDVQAAVVVQRLLEFDGVSQGDVAKLTGLKVTEVRRAAKVAGSAAAMGASEQHDLSFDDLAAVAEFDGDDEAVARVIDVATNRHWQLDHAVADLRRERDDRAARQVVAQRLAAAEVRVIDVSGDNWLPEDAAWIDYLVGRKDKPMTEAQHRGCPGHAAAVVETDDGYEPAYLCLDPTGYDHTFIDATLAEAAPEASEPVKQAGLSDEDKAARNRSRAINKAWPTATTVRRRYMAKLLARRSAPKGTLRFATEMVLSHPDLLKNGDDNTLATILGKERQGSRWDRSVAAALVAEASEAQLPVVLFAQVAAAFEAQQVKKTSWKVAGPQFAAYLTFLSSTGYGLSEVEQDLAGLSEGVESEDLAA
jgi:ParB family chromosome partitioning protein